SELLHAAGIVLFSRDIASPLVNFGWLGVALLAAWCIGRPYGVAPLTLVAVALAMDTAPMGPRQAGTLATDTAPGAPLRAAAASLINAWAASGSPPAVEGGGDDVPEGNPREPRMRRVAPEGTVIGAAILIAGLAIGLALGNKLTVGGAGLAMAVGLALIVPRDYWRKALGLFIAGVAITAAF